MQTFRQNIRTSGFWDKTGAAVSWACAAHCLAMPLIISALPLVGLGFLAHEGVEFVFIGLSVVVAAISLLPGFFRFHRRLRTLILFTGGLGLMIAADPLFAENLAGRTITVAGGAALITTAHFLNRYLCRKCRSCGKNDCRSSV